MTEVRITDPETGGQKGQKDERYDLFPFDALDEVARVYSVGAKKYEDDNWLRGYAWRLSAGALLRHVARFMCGEDRDPETGCLHLAHACWHTLTLLTFYLRGLGTDDRKKCELDEPIPFSVTPLPPLEAPTHMRPVAPPLAFVQVSADGEDEDVWPPHPKCGAV